MGSPVNGMAKRDVVAAVVAERPVGLGVRGRVRDAWLAHGHDLPAQLDEFLCEFLVGLDVFESLADDFVLRQAEVVGRRLVHIDNPHVGVDDIEVVGQQVDERGEQPLTEPTRFPDHFVAHGAVSRGDPGSRPWMLLRRARGSLYRLDAIPASGHWLQRTADHCQRSRVTTTLSLPAGIGSSSRSLKPGALTSTM